MDFTEITVGEVMTDKPKTLRERWRTAEIPERLSIGETALNQLEQMAARQTRVDTFLLEMRIVLVDGVEGEALYVNNYRVAGPKPWGGGKVLKEWKVDLTNALARYEGREG